jgi:membrane-associated phospholipid phosphatase
MTRKNVLIALLGVSAVVTVLAILCLDRPVAEFVRSSGFEGAWIFSQGTHFLDTISGKDISKFLLGFTLIGSGIAALLLERTRAYGRMLLFVGLVQSIATLLCGVSKNLFGRLRPCELFETGYWDQAWFAGSSSFPSGHVGFYCGLFLPIAWIFPRWRWPLMTIPLFVAAARINANDHFLSDVTVSTSLTSLVVLAVARAMHRWLEPPHTTGNLSKLCGTTPMIESYLAHLMCFWIASAGLSGAM